MAARGVTTATFDFPYIAAGRRIPDKGPVLEDAWRTAIARARAHPAFRGMPLAIGGKSMGGRMASQVAAQDPTGLLGWSTTPSIWKTRAAPRSAPPASMPMLFVQHVDTFGTAADPRTAAAAERLDGASRGGRRDHSLTPARSGRQPRPCSAASSTPPRFIRSAIQHDSQRGGEPLSPPQPMDVSSSTRGHRTVHSNCWSAFTATRNPRRDAGVAAHHSWRRGGRPSQLGLHRIAAGLRRCELMTRQDREVSSRTTSYVNAAVSARGREFRGSYAVRVATAFRAGAAAAR